MRQPNSSRRSTAVYGCSELLPRYMRPRKSNTLATLTRTAPDEGKFKWTKVEQDAFNENKPIVARNTLLTYLDFNEAFKSSY